MSMQNPPKSPTRQDSLKSSKALMARNVSIRPGMPTDWRPADFWLPDKDIAFLYFLVKDPSEMLNKYAGSALMERFFSDRRCWLPLGLYWVWA
jgi:hypothetical protein